jgi:uncharacterized protein
MLPMYTRDMKVPERSFFLFGPRGTGKTTWLQSMLPNAHWVNLLLDRELVRLMRDPGRFSQEVEALPAGSWVVVDELQKLPPLLNEVQDLIARHGRRYRYSLTGSSARKLRRENVNMLAGRVINRQFFPLTASEIGDDFDIGAVLRFGCLPAVVSERKDTDRIDLLDAYATNYLVQEIRQEALVKSLESFGRFLQVAALMNAQVVNVAGIARDAAVARPTVQGYFDILIDTLVGVWLPAWRPRAKVKEVEHPKFYFFDTGAARALAGHLREPVTDTERGHLLETYVLHELRAYMNRSGCGGQLYYWRTPSGSEVDFIWMRASKAVGIEVKAADRWRSGDGMPLTTLREAGKIRSAFAVYLGSRGLRDGPVDVLPVRSFLAGLAGGDVIG